MFKIRDNIPAQKQLRNDKVKWTKTYNTAAFFLWVFSSTLDLKLSYKAPVISIN